MDLEDVAGMVESGRWRDVARKISHMSPSALRKLPRSFVKLLEERLPGSYT